MKNQIPEQVKAVRSDRLLALTEAQAKAYRAQFQGEEETLLLEEICGYGPKQYWIGSTMRYVTGAVEIGENGACGTRCQGREAGGQEEKLRPGMLLRGTFTGETIPFSRGDAARFIPLLYTPYRERV
jgi:threonylcarbamoyladenosine tRNA methylthiotransferase MtaB